MHKSILALFLGVALVSQVACIPAGIAASLDADVMKDFTQPVAPMIINIMNKLNIPEIDVDHFEITEVKMAINQIDPQYITMAASGADNALRMTASNVAGKITGRFKYQWLLLFCHGDFEVEILDGGAALYASMPMTSQTYGAKMLPAIQVDGFYFQIDKDKTSISISGSITADIVNLFIQVFQDLVLTILMDIVNQQVPEILATDVNQFIYKTGGLIVLEKLFGIGFDFSYSHLPIISDTQMDFYLNGTIFNSKFGEVSPGEGFGDLYIDQTTKGNIQIDVSRYTVESFFVSLYETGKLQLTLTNEMIPQTSSMVLTTSSLEEFFPGLESTFGKDLPMAIKIQAIEFPKAVMSPGSMSGIISLALEFIVEGQGSAFILNFMQAQAWFEVSITDFILHIKFDNMKIGDVTLSNCVIPVFDTKAMKIVINSAAKLLTPMINAILYKGFPIPQHYFQYVEVKDVSFISFQDYVKVQFAPIILN